MVWIWPAYHERVSLLPVDYFLLLSFRRLDDDSPDTQELSKLLSTVCLKKVPFIFWLLTKSVFTQTFKARLPSVIDQAQHFASINAASGGGGTDASMTFREGLDGTERECGYRPFIYDVYSHHECSVQFGTGKYKTHESMV